LWSNLQRWRGIALVAAALVATVWLAASNQLVLYIHPRYIVFTVIMAVIALALVVAGLLARRNHRDDEDAPPARLPRVLSFLGLAIAAVIAITMVALPPATLTSATADQRSINSTTVGAQAQNADTVASAPAGAFAKFTVVDWASLLRQTNDLAFYSGKPVDVVGFITVDPDDPANVFYVSRFVVTCCAVDAQPVGIPVYYPNWTSAFKAGDWVEATGGFAANRSTASAQGIALEPTKVLAVGQPSEPYLY
jgi:putative membrane protein